MEQLDLVIAGNVQRIMSAASLGVTDLADRTGMRIEVLRQRLSAETSFTVVELAHVAVALDCTAEALLPSPKTRRDPTRGSAEPGPIELKSNRFQTFCDVNHFTFGVESSISSDRPVTAERALMCATENIPRLDGFTTWRTAVPGLPYHSGSEPHAVALVVIHDPRDGRVQTATLVATSTALP